MNAFAEIRPEGVETRPPSFFPWRLQSGLTVFQWGSNPHNPPAIFTLVGCYICYSEEGTGRAAVMNVLVKGTLRRRLTYIFFSFNKKFNI